MTSDSLELVLKEGVAAWNSWRLQNPEEIPDLEGVNLEGRNLHGINFKKVKQFLKIKIGLQQDHKEKVMTENN